MEGEVVPGERIRIEERRCKPQSWGSIIGKLERRAGKETKLPDAIRGRLRECVVIEAMQRECSQEGMVIHSQ